MNRYVNLFSAIFLCSSLLACQSKTEQSPVEESAGTPKEIVEVNDEVTLEMEPDDQLTHALESFSRNDYASCATDLKESAKFMDDIASTADPKTKGAIESAAKSIEHLSTKVAAKEVTDISVINKVLGMAGRALAGNRLRITQNEFTSQSNVKSSNLLSKTIYQLEKSIVTHHRALTKEENQIFNDAQEVARKLKNGENVTEAEMKEAIHKIDLEIEKWNKEFKSI